METPTQNPTQNPTHNPIQQQILPSNNSSTLSNGNISFLTKISKEETLDQPSEKLKGLTGLVGQGLGRTIGDSFGDSFDSFPKNPRNKSRVSFIVAEIHGLLVLLRRQGVLKLSLTKFQELQDRLRSCKGNNEVIFLLFIIFYIRFK